MLTHKAARLKYNMLREHFYKGHSKSSKTNSKKYFIYEIYKIIFLHSFHPIHNIFPSKNSVLEFFDGNIAHRSVMNWMEPM